METSAVQWRVKELEIKLSTKMKFLDHKFTFLLTARIDLFKCIKENYCTSILIQKRKNLIGSIRSQAGDKGISLNLD